MNDNAAGRTEPRSLFLAAWGIGCFVLFLLCLGTAEYKYICALASAVLMAWVYRAGSARLPAGGGAPLASLVPVAIGALSLAVLALAPLATGNIKKYLAFVQALTGIRI